MTKQKLYYYFIDGKDNKVFEEDDLSVLIGLIKDRIDDDVIKALGKNYTDYMTVQDNLEAIYDYLEDSGDDCEETYNAEYPYTFGVEFDYVSDYDEPWDEEDYEDYWSDINSHNLDHDDDIYW